MTVTMSMPCSPEPSTTASRIVTRRVPEAALWTIGSLVTAALYAPTTPLAVCSPTSGFHHAGYAHGGGYCTFNGLMVAAATFIQDHPGAKLGILDCDFHYGDGTADILRRKPELAEHVVHHTSGQHFDDGADPDESFLLARRVHRGHQRPGLRRHAVPGRRRHAHR